MSLPLYLYDDPTDATAFLPFSDSRPLAELRYGALQLRERIASRLSRPAGLLAAPHLAAFRETGAPKVLAEPADEQALFLRSTFVPDVRGFTAIRRATAGTSRAGARSVRFADAAGATVGAIIAGRDWRGPAALPASLATVALPGTRLEGAWRIIADLMATLGADLAAQRARHGRGRTPRGCTVLGPPGLLMVEPAAIIEPGVVFDTRSGPIWIQDRAEVLALTRLGGPVVIGEGTRVLGGSIKGSSIGPRCVVHGEISTSVFLGYANKSHDGFLGHSVVGRWVNIGAGTITSNLKNTYGPVRLNLGASRVETGLTFLGSLIGDHVKTAIGTMLPTGCVVGTGANLFGDRRPASLVPAFAWGTDEPERRLACRMFLQTAARVLPRRDVACDAPMRAWLEALWTHCTGQPCD